MKDPEPGRAAALAAFDRSLDGAAPARTVRDAIFRPGAHRSDEDGPTTVLRFDLDGSTIDLRIRGRGDLRSLAGLIDGDFDHVEVFLRRPGERSRLFVGVDGAFHATGLRPGPLSLVVERPEHPLALTDWFNI
ncbi:hypothetical protein [Nocardiopsis alkaliphila]|uniref:hypothetical protein n=1 Tax=Nocardiopsis alkaliphila TaxID=225762 RepID=UPI0003460C6F|nr:hypothetical protein [Nocardiopsis alkaliphila]